MAPASAATVHELAAYRAEFPIFQDRIYLNTCSLGPLSARSRARVAEFLDTWQSRGAPAWYDVWWDALAALRQGYAGVIGAAPDEVAIHASISTATAAVASALDYGSRRKVVTTALDFPTLAYQWQAWGVDVEVLESEDGVTVPIEAFARAVDERTALVATSHVYYTSGAVQNIGAIVELAHRAGALCLIDAYQSAGQMPLDVHAEGVDFLCGGGLKWLLGGPGIAFLYVRRDLVQHLKPRATGWFAHRDQFAFDPRRFDRWDDARRFEQGTPALPAVFAQLGGLEILREVGLERIRAVTQYLTDDLVARARAAGLSLNVASSSTERSAIVPVAVEDPSGAVRRLAAAGIVADARPGLVRLSPYFYNVMDDHAAAIAILAS